MRLAQLQRALQAHVLRGDETIVGYIPGSARFDTATRLGVYAQGYAERLIEALAQTYPALQARLGAELFASVLRRMAHEAPSRHFSVRDYGGELAERLARTLTGARGAGAADLARFEWLLAAAFDAADAEPLPLDALSQIAPARWAQLRFTAAPSLRTVELSSNAVAFWKAACAQAPRPSRWRRTAPRRWLIWRRELALYFRPLAGDEAAALAALSSGASFGQQCAVIARTARQHAPALRAAALLRGWLSEGLLSGLR